MGADGRSALRGAPLMTCQQCGRGVAIGSFHRCPATRAVWWSWLAVLLVGLAFAAAGCFAWWWSVDLIAERAIERHVEVFHAGGES